jgi:MFS family permease
LGILNEYKGIPHEANLLNIASFFNWMAAGLFFNTLTVFLLLQGIGLGTSGLMLTVFGIVSATSTLFFGGLADRYGRKRFVISGGVLASLSIAIFGVVPANGNFGLAILFGAVLVGGLSEAMYAVSWGAMLADKSTNSKRTVAFSLSFFISTISFAVGGFSPALLGPLASVYHVDLVTGHRYLFVTTAALSLLGPGIVSKVSESRTARPVGERFHLVPRKSRKVVSQYTVAGVLIALGAGMVIPLIGGWAYLKFNLTDDVTAPILGGLNSLVMGVANLATPRLARKFGTVKTIVLTQASSTVFLFSLPFTTTFPVASVLFITRSTLMMMSNPTEQSLLMALVAEDERSSASAITAALWRLPNSLTTVFGGYLMGLGGFYLALPFFLCTILYLSSISYFWLAFKNVRLPEEKVAVPLQAIS